MKAAVSGLSRRGCALDIKLTQLAKLFPKDAKEFKIVQRAGTFVTLGDVVDSSGRECDAFVMFDFVKMTRCWIRTLQSGLNNREKTPCSYVQYANARVSFVFAQTAAEAGVATDIEPFNAPI